MVLNRPRSSFTWKNGYHSEDFTANDDSVCNVIFCECFYFDIDYNILLYCAQHDKLLGPDILRKSSNNLQFRLRLWKNWISINSIWLLESLKQTGMEPKVPQDNFNYFYYF